MKGKNSHQPKPRKEPARALKYTPKPAKAKPSLPNPTIPTQSRITEATQSTDPEQITHVIKSPQAPQSPEPARPEMTFGYPPKHQPDMSFGTPSQPITDPHHFLFSPTESTEGSEMTTRSPSQSFQLPRWCCTLSAAPCRLSPPTSPLQSPELTSGLSQPRFSGPFGSELTSETISAWDTYVHAIEGRDEAIGDLKLELAEMNLKMAEQEHEADGSLQVLERGLLLTKIQNAGLQELNELLHMLLNEWRLLQTEPACPVHGDWLQ